MATVNGSAIGNLSGKLGNLTARTVWGKTILAARPSNFTPSMDPIVVENRSKFGITSNFAKFVITIGTLELIWKFVKKPGMSVFNTVLKYNFPFVSVLMPTLQNVITPLGFNPPVASAAVDENGLTASVTALNEVADIIAEEVNLSAMALICFHDPISPELIPYQIIPVVKEIESFNFSAPYNLNIQFSTFQNSIKSQYGKYLLFLAFASKDYAGNVIRYSSTFAKQSI